MGKNKLKKFAEINSFPNVLQPDYISDTAHFQYKGKWSKDFFGNNNPLVLEIGCGKGEYTVGLATEHPDKNFIGIDIKGDRLWQGAKRSLDAGLKNTAFLRIQAEKIEQYFGENEVSEIWLTFPDPQPNKPRIKKRLTSPAFIERYRKILVPNSPVHLKTDNKTLFEFTLQVIEKYNLKPNIISNDLYNCNEKRLDKAAKSIQTYYEKSFVEEGAVIYYLKLSLGDESKS